MYYYMFLLLLLAIHPVTCDDILDTVRIFDKRIRIGFTNMGHSDRGECVNISSNITIVVRFTRVSIIHNLDIKMYAQHTEEIINMTCFNADFKNTNNCKNGYYIYK